MNKLTKISLLRFCIHLLVLVFLFVLPEMVLNSESSNPHQHDVWRFYAKAIVYVLVFYIEYYVILRPRSSESEPQHIFTWKFVVENLVLIVVAAIAVYPLLPQPPPHEPAKASMELGLLLRELMIVVLTISLALAMKLAERINYFNRRRVALENDRREQELRQLKSQLNPHFLFNSLNTIYALTEIDSSRARDANHTLSRLLRYALYDADTPTVELGREIDFITDYVKLMKMRLSDATTVNLVINMTDEARKLPIAPLLFISPVENAFKHGVSNRAGETIEIKLNATVDGSVDCVVVNDISQCRPDNFSEGHGVGSSNLRRRLELIYGSDAELLVRNMANKYALAMHIKLKSLVN